MNPLSSSTRVPIVYANTGRPKNFLYHGTVTGTVTTFVDGSPTDFSASEAVNANIFRHPSQSARCIMYEFLADCGKLPAANAAIASASRCSPDAASKGPREADLR